MSGKEFYRRSGADPFQPLKKPVGKTGTTFLGDTGKGDHVPIGGEGRAGFLVVEAGEAAFGVEGVREMRVGDARTGGENAEGVGVIALVFNEADANPGREDPKDDAGRTGGSVWAIVADAFGEGKGRQIVLVHAGGYLEVGLAEALVAS